MQNVPIHLDFKGKHLVGVADPIDANVESGVPTAFTVYIGGKYLGTLSCEKKGWMMDRPVDVDLVENLGNYIHAWYE